MARPGEAGRASCRYMIRKRKNRNDRNVNKKEIPPDIATRRRLGQRPNHRHSLPRMPVAQVKEKQPHRQTQKEDLPPTPHPLAYPPRAHTPPPRAEPTCPASFHATETDPTTSLPVLHTARPIPGLRRTPCLSHPHGTAGNVGLPSDHRQVTKGKNSGTT